MGLERIHRCYSMASVKRHAILTRELFRAGGEASSGQPARHGRVGGAGREVPSQIQTQASDFAPPTFVRHSNTEFECLLYLCVSSMADVAFFLITQRSRVPHSPKSARHEGTLFKRVQFSRSLLQGWTSVFPPQMFVFFHSYMFNFSSRPGLLYTCALSDQTEGE